MDRRNFLRRAALLPTLPVIAIAGPTPPDKQDIHEGKLIARFPETTTMKQANHLRTALKKFHDGEIMTLAVPDYIEILRAG